MWRCEINKTQRGLVDGTFCRSTVIQTYLSLSAIINIYYRAFQTPLFVSLFCLWGCIYSKYIHWIAEWKLAIFSGNCYFAQFTFRFTNSKWFANLKWFSYYFRSEELYLGLLVKMSVLSWHCIMLKYKRDTSCWSMPLSLTKKTIVCVYACKSQRSRCKGEMFSVGKDNRTIITIFPPECDHKSRKRACFQLLSDVLSQRKPRTLNRHVHMKPRRSVQFKQPLSPGTTRFCGSPKTP